MQITTLKLLNFRNYDQLEIRFSKNCNIIFGKNGMGKTNLIEAIYILSLTKSFRDGNDKVLIKDDKTLAKISGNVINDIENNYQVIINDLGKRVKINNNLCHKISDYISKINVVLFNPDDLRFIKDTPSIRRRYLNVDISEFDNSYLICLSNYNKLIKQRNSYLKTMYFNSNASKEYLDILTNKIIDYGMEIYQKRNKFINLINKYLNYFYKKITDKYDLKLEYVSDLNELSKEDIIKKFNLNLEKDMLFGKTHFGIHHDDLIFKINDKLIKEFGSEGQQKNAIIAYKLSQIQMYKDIQNKLPILILDDLFSELDNEKINNILNLLDVNVQTFITTTSIDKIDEKIIKNSKLIKVEDGKIMEV